MGVWGGLINDGTQPQPHPFARSSHGKPEPRKHALSGYGSRRLTEEHGIVGKVVVDAVLITKLRYRY